MWDLIVSVPDHCLSFYFGVGLQSFYIRKSNVALFQSDHYNCMKEKVLYLLCEDLHLSYYNYGESLLIF